MKSGISILALLLVASLIAVTASKTAVAAQPARPNILYFYVDDMGWGSIGPNGQAARKSQNLPYVRTPNLDRLAAQGVNFTRGYGCHVCSPARSSQQTGFHQGHTFADRNDPNNAKKAIRSDDVTMGDALMAAGYATGYWGKWGYGGSKDQANPVIENVQTLPTSHGYQHVLAELHHVRAHTFFQPTLWRAPTRSNPKGNLKLVKNSLARYQNNSSYPNAPALQNHRDYPTTSYCDDAYAFAALDFVRAQGRRYNETGKPFFGLLAVQIPHAPFGEITTLPDWDKAYADDPHYKALADQTRQWAAMVTRIDAHFGNILAALEDPNNDGDTADSIVDNTLVIFQSDNGGPGGKNNVELNANGGLSGVKGRIQEGGIRVPLVMRWPAKITPQSKLKAGSRCDMIVDVTDLLPTFCQLAGVPAPVGVDGVSIAPTLLGEGRQRRREFLIHEAGNGQSIIRGKHKLVRAKRAPRKLYDLEADPAESNNIAPQHPKLVKELETLLLGERVAEPRGFANTYHHWIGANNAETSDPSNWSDYEYANEGVTYMRDDGAPRLSWIARITNSGDRPNVARVDNDLKVLGLEISGNPANRARQSLVLAPNVNLEGRNEIRLNAHAALTLNGGALSSLRWIDIHSGATLRGHGVINGEVYNHGNLSIIAGAETMLRVDGDYRQGDNATLHLDIGTADATDQPVMTVDGMANVGGQLTLELVDGFKSEPGAAFTILAADAVSGRFANPEDEVTTAGGARFRITYSNSAITLTAK